jgi:hypothetical protein
VAGINLVFLPVASVFVACPIVLFFQFTFVLPAHGSPTLTIYDWKSFAF